MEADSGGTSEQSQLQPFIHQVGGHSSMLQLDDNTICKPLIPNELNFYKSSPEFLKTFLPEFRGVIEVTFTKDKDGYLGLTTYLPSSYKISSMKFGSQNSLQEKSESKTKHRIRVSQCGSIQIESDCSDDKKPTFEGSQVKGQNGSQLNPWVMHCHQEQLKKMRNSPSLVSQKYILLENLTAKYEFPCILDIKMGTRPYGDDATFAKRQSHMAKVVTTTSTSLGVRICGIQVYHHDSGHFICHNKYYGRALNVEGFRQALHHFLHNGTELRHDVISQLLEKLHKLQKLVRSLDTFRFFTSSLLIIYNGIVRSQSEVHNHNFHENSELKQGVTLQFCDNGNVDKETKASSNSYAEADMSCDGQNGEHGCLSISQQQSAHHTVDESNKQTADIVNVRMIDFAHSTQSQIAAQASHTGPDDGYLFGLENLVAQLKMFQTENV